FETLTMDKTGLDHISVQNFGETLTIGANETFQGSGDLGGAQTVIINNGTLTAIQASALNLTPSTGGLTNNGTIQATNAGGLVFGGPVTSSGTVNVGSSSLTVNGSYTQTGGTLELAGGTIQSSATLNFQAGLIDARG